MDKATKPEQKAVVKKFSISTLAKNSRKLFGVSQSTFAGATFGMTGEYTVDEMKAIISKWLKKPAVQQKKKEVE